MPLYDFFCLNCNFERLEETTFEDRKEQECPKCGTKLSPIGAPATVTFERGWYEHIAPTPIFCDSARELKEACNKHDSYSPYLESSPWRRGL